MAADQDEQFTEDKKAQAFLAEAEKLFAGGNTKLYSVWESIEDGRLKEAVQLIEELRSLKDAETTARIEGAIKWLGRGYYNRAKTKMRGDEFAETISAYEAAVHVDPGYALAFNGLAWLRATCLVAEFRDGAKAVEQASKAGELTLDKFREVTRPWSSLELVARLVDERRADTTGKKPSAEQVMDILEQALGSDESVEPLRMFLSTCRGSRVTELGFAKIDNRVPTGGCGRDQC